MNETEKSVESGRRSVKLWLKENWVWVVSGISVVALTVFASKNGGTVEEETIIEPFVIDKRGDKWMDVLTVPFDTYRVTVREATNLADYYHKLVQWAYDHDSSITEEIEANFSHEYETDNPEKFDSIVLALV